VCGVDDGDVNGGVTCARGRVTCEAGQGTLDVDMRWDGADGIGAQSAVACVAHWCPLLLFYLTCIFCVLNCVVVADEWRNPTACGEPRRT
jgi:hypothetical protein